jgi:hypothetical protein
MQDANSPLDPVPRPLYLYAGTCEDLGAIQWPLNSLTSPPGTRGGPDEAERTEYAFTANVPIAIPDMLRSSFALNVHAGEDQPVDSIACGNISGVADSVGTLVIGLRPVADSDITGIAVLSPSPSDPSMTYISVFITGELLGTETGTIGLDIPVGTTDGDVNPPADTSDPVVDQPVDPGPPPSDDDDDDGDDDDGDDDD